MTTDTFSTVSKKKPIDILLKDYRMVISLKIQLRKH